MNNRLDASKLNLQEPASGDTGATPSPAAQVHSILLVDDGDDTRLMTKWFLANLGYHVDAARSAEEGLLQFDPKLYDLVVTDNSMPGMSGLEMAHVIKMRSPSTPVVMYTGRIPERHSCVDAVIQRPAHLLFLRETIERLLAGLG
jgi:two-component system, cell cycle sensor histidine kinase and response regulator CckA